jgi:Ca2+-binding EF-hand superfamily protein
MERGAPARGDLTERGTAMLSELQAAKLDRRFELLDSDGDGYITADDYDAAAANVCNAFGVSDLDPHFERIQLSYLRLWERLTRRMDPQHTGRISRDKYIASCAELIVEAEDGYERNLRPIADAIFDAIDADGNDELDLDELTAWFNAYGVCSDDAERVFRVLDRDENEKLDRGEVNAAIREFYIGDDPAAPGNKLFGPLTVTLPH